jgi:hypothetical protein
LPQCRGNGTSSPGRHPPKMTMPRPFFPLCRLLRGSDCFGFFVIDMTHRSRGDPNTLPVVFFRMGTGRLCLLSLCTKIKLKPWMSTMSWMGLFRKFRHEIFCHYSVWAVDPYKCLHTEPSAMNGLVEIVDVAPFGGANRQ